MERRDNYLEHLIKLFFWTITSLFFICKGYLPDAALLRRNNAHPITVLTVQPVL